MAVINLTDAFCYVEGYDFTTDTNNAVLSTDVAQLDATTFGSGGWQAFAGGLRTTSLTWSGFWQAASGAQAVDNQAFNELAANRVHTIGPVETEAQPVYMFEAMKSQYTLGGTVGEIAPFSLTATNTDGVGMARGQLAKAKGVPGFTGVGQLGTALNLGALSSTQYLYATFHAFVATETITIEVQSDSASNFPSPTTLATIGPHASSDGTWMPRVAGPITDTWFRLYVSAGNATGANTVAGAIGLR